MAAARLDIRIGVFDLIEEMPPTRVGGLTG